MVSEVATRGGVGRRCRGVRIAEFGIEDEYLWGRGTKEDGENHEGKGVGRDGELTHKSEAR